MVDDDKIDPSLEIFTDSETGETFYALTLVQPPPGGRNAYVLRKGHVAKIAELILPHVRFAMRCPRCNEVFIHQTDEDRQRLRAESGIER
jgi:hypothetical protein